jgi:hypothetical protein
MQEGGSYVYLLQRMGDFVIFRGVLKATAGGEKGAP